ncbi:hypothetical protein HY624_03995 [Candidatus Uhrbacteria bacterium]|nr:hypothetical protein [Candidatus Uhrbacteria bacterium]
MTNPTYILLSIWVTGLLMLWVVFVRMRRSFMDIQKKAPPHLNDITLGYLPIPGDRHDAPSREKRWYAFGFLAWFASWGVAGMFGYYVRFWISELVYRPMFGDDSVIIHAIDHDVWFAIIFGSVVGLTLCSMGMVRLFLWRRRVYYREMLRHGPITIPPQVSAVHTDREDADEDFGQSAVHADAVRAAAAIRDPASFDYAYRVSAIGQRNTFFFLLLFIWIFLGAATIAMADTYIAVTKDGVVENRFWSLSPRTIAWDDATRASIMYREKPLSLIVYPQSGEQVVIAFIDRRSQIQEHVFLQTIAYAIATEVLLDLFIFDPHRVQREVALTTGARAELRDAVRATDALEQLKGILAHEAARGQTQ